MSEEFSKKVIEFYETYVGSLADAVEILADIQENYGERYEILEKIEEEPESILEFTEELSEDELKTLLINMIKLSTLSRKASRMFELSPEEKRELAEELREFAENIKTDLPEEDE